MTKNELLKQVDVYKDEIMKLNLSKQQEKVLFENGAIQNIQAYQYITKAAENKEQMIDEEMIKQIYAYVSGDESKNYRTSNSEPLKTHTPPAPEELEHFMGHFMGQMQMSKKMFHPIEFAGLVYKRIMDIRPFKAKNEEVALALMNFVLMQSDYPMINIAGDNKEYEAALEKAQHPSSPDVDRWFIFVANKVLEAQKKYRG